nr:MAG TPA: hypothetical protein [Caudoviricetes sp.]
MTENTPPGPCVSQDPGGHSYTNRTTQPARRERENEHHPPH